MTTMKLGIGTIDYEDTGPRDGRPVVFVHGLMMAGNLWSPFTERLAATGLRCIAPTWPLGAHAAPMRDPDAVTMPGIAAAVCESLAALELDDVVLIANDTGGLVAQIAATHDASRIGALVLTSCDAFEHFPPPALKPLVLAAKSATTFRAALQTLRVRLARERSFGPLAHTDIDDLVAGWVAASLADAGVAADLRAFTLSLQQQTSLDAAAALPGFTKPALIAWSADDEFFPLQDGRRLADTLPDARLETIEGARTFSMIDQPDALAAVILEFLGTAAAAAAA